MRRRKWGSFASMLAGTSLVVTGSWLATTPALAQPPQQRLVTQAPASQGSPVPAGAAQPGPGVLQSYAGPIVQGAPLAGEAVPGAEGVPYAEPVSPAVAAFADGRPNHHTSPFWVRGEYLLWNINKGQLPNLNFFFTFPFTVMQSTFTDGVLTLSEERQFTVEVDVLPGIAGGYGFDDPERSGFRLMGGLWPVENGMVGLEGGYFQLANHTSYLANHSDRFFDVTTPFSDQFLVTGIQTVNVAQGGAGGGGADQAGTGGSTVPILLPTREVTSLTAFLTNRLLGAELSGSSEHIYLGNASCNAVGGFRFLEFEESLRLATSVLVQSNVAQTIQGISALNTQNTTTTSSTNPNTGVTTVNTTTTNQTATTPLNVTTRSRLLEVNRLTTDLISASNHFYGGQLGTNFDWYWGKWFVAGFVKLGLGQMHQELDVEGSTLFSVRALDQVAVNGVITSSTPRRMGPVLLGGGQLSLPEDVGHYERNKICFIPEVSANLGYQFTRGIRGFVGYNFMYVSSVLRPGAQSQTTDTFTRVRILDTDDTFGFRRQAVRLDSIDMWTQGIQCGMEFSF